MAKRLAFCLVLAAAAAVSACAGNADPHEGGFLSGVGALASGGYQQRIDQRQAEVASLGAEQAQLQARADSIRQEQAQVDRNLRSARARLSQLDRRIAALRSRGADSAKLAEAEQRLSLARSKANEAANRDRSTSDRAADVADLQQVLNSVGGLVDEIARTSPTS